MKLSRIKIEKLFGQFDYDIKLNQEEGITILTGPNGYGKTTILNIIWSLFTSGSFLHCSGGTVILSDGNVDRELKFPGNSNEIKNKVPVYLIKDQRIRKTVMEEKYNSIVHEKVERTKNVIGMLSQELKNYIAEIRAREDEKAKALNASYAKRLFKYNKVIPKDEFEKRYEGLTEKYQLLQKYKIYQNDLEKAEYEGENQRAFSIYLEDWEIKIAIYDELLAKIKLFLSIMDNKGMTNKSFTVNAAQGFCFTSSDGKPLDLSNLSSGEQHETILLYEMLFNAPPDSLVLIDEPETSMHIAWQIEFLNDIEKIAKLSKLSFIIATHAPDLINDKMDLCVDLFENTRRNGND
ncbi:MAG: AAA family ATPase [Dysgonamonadaceae bacterium]|jgi:predicted ATP-binding protein involved in virulence|nr:AAA family ATPase [Dysgonamonadaceae bacterium]